MAGSSFLVMVTIRAAGLLASIAQAISPPGPPAGYAPSVNPPAVNAPVAANPGANPATRPAPTRASVRPEAASGLVTGQSVDEVGSEGFVLAMGGVGGFKEELREIR